MAAPRSGRSTRSDAVRARPSPDSRGATRSSAASEVSSPHLRFGDLEIIPDEGVVRRSGEEIHLTKTEFRLLVELGSSPGRVLTNPYTMPAVKVRMPRPCV